MLHFSFYNFKVQERDIYEYYLNQKAQKGYELQWFNDFVHCFKKTNQQKHYYVDYNRNVKLNGHRYLDEEQQKQIEFYESNGYHFECNYKYFMVYSSETQLPPLHTDEEVEAGEQTKSYKSNMKFHAILPAISTIVILLFLVNPSFH